MKTMATVEENEAKMIAGIKVTGTNDGTDNPDANRDDGDGNDDGDAMLTNGT